MCTTCQNIGHVKQSCPEEIVIPALPMPPPKEWVVNFLDAILEDVMGRLSFLYSPVWHFYVSIIWCMCSYV